MIASENQAVADGIALKQLDNAKYDYTQHILDPPPTMVSDVKDERVDNLKVTHIKPDGSAFVIHNFLTKAECEDLIEQAEQTNFTSVNLGIRVVDRLSLFGKEVATMLFERARVHLKQECVTFHDQNDPNDQSNVSDSQGGVESVMSAGSYVPYACNPVLRICRYAPGGLFAPHKDGGHGVTSTNASIKTVMVYLNDAFTGGQTTFFTDEQDMYRDPDPNNIVFALTPKVGDCLVFNHGHIQDGGKLISGKKYILRSEIMYRKALSEEVASASDNDETADDGG